MKNRRKETNYPLSAIYEQSDSDIDAIFKKLKKEDK